MNLKRIKQAFSISLLVIYIFVIFQEGIVTGMHFLSHASDIFTHQFAYHQHGNGKFHVHHRHGFMETFKKVFAQDEGQNKPQNQENLPNQKEQFKFHLPVKFHDDIDEIEPGKMNYPFYVSRFISIYLDILTPPPKV